MKKFLGLTAAAFLATTTFASAATLSFLGTGSTVTLGANFDPVGTIPGYASGSTITTGVTLALTGPATLTYMFMGAEAAGVDLIKGTGIFPTLKNTAAIGTSRTSFVNQALAALTQLNFTFSNTETGDDYNNITGGPSGVKVGFSQIFNTPGGQYVYAFFEDGTDGTDFDDMIVKISAVPVPAAGALLLTGLGGLSLMRRRRKA